MFLITRMYYDVAEGYVLNGKSAKFFAAIYLGVSAIFAGAHHKPEKKNPAINFLGVLKAQCAHSL